jgi:hypothetical protein
MSATSATDHRAIDVLPAPKATRRIAVTRAGLALLWAAALVPAVGDHVPTTGSDLPVAAAVLLATYPAIDVVASLVGARFAPPAAARLLRLNAAISALAVVALAVTAFGADAGRVLVAFGAWAAVSGAIQFGTAVRRRRIAGGQLPMIISGGLSTLAGISFLASARSHDAHLSGLAGYMALGAVLYLLWARRSRTSSATA